MRLLFADNFNKANTSAINLKNAGGTPGTGTIALTSTLNEFFTGGQATKITTSTVNNEVAQYHRFVGSVNDHPIVVFGGLFSVQDANPLTISFNLGHRDGTNLYTHRLTYTTATGVWSYIDDAGAENTVATRALTITGAYTPVWHRFVLGVNTVTHAPVFIGVDEVQFGKNSLPAALRSAADTSASNVLDFWVEIKNKAVGAAAVVILDSMFGVALRTLGTGGSGEEGIDEALEDAYAALYGGVG